MTLPVGDIASLIPQKHPFVMVGRLLSADENSTTSSYIIPADHVFTEDGVFSEAGLLENIAQTAAAGAGYKAKQAGQQVKPGYIAAVKDFEVFDLPHVNDELLTEVEIENQVFNVTVVKGRISRGGRLLAQCEMRIFIAE